MPRSGVVLEGECSETTSRHTSKWVDGYEHTTDPGVDVTGLPALAEVLVDALVADRRKKRHIRHADGLLLEAFLPIRLAEHKCGPHISIEQAYFLYFGRRLLLGTAEYLLARLLRRRLQGHLRQVYAYIAH